MRQYHNNNTSISNNKGMAIITALLITLLLTLVVIGLAHRVGMFVVNSRENVIKSQNLYTAEIGLNEARYFLMSEGCLPPNFEACFPSLQSDANKQKDFADSKLIDITTDVGELFDTALPEFDVAGEKFKINFDGSFSHNSNNNFNFKTFVKQTNIPKVLNIVAISSRPGNEIAKTVIDAGLIYTKPVGSDYKQMGQGGTREGISGEALGDAATNVRANF